MNTHLDLRTGRSVWEAKRAPSVDVARLNRDVKTDVLVVGMGMSGAMLADALTQAGHSVVLIDRRRSALLGSTVATTALVQFEIDQPLTKLAGMIGADDAGRAWRRSRLAVTNLAGRIDELGIKCGLQRRRSLYLAGNVLAPGALREEAESRRAIGIDAAYLSPAELEQRFGIDRLGAILSQENLSLEPRKLAAGFLNAALSRDARLYASAEATGFEESTGRVEVGTKEGPTITAGHVVLATGYELTSIVPKNGHRVLSTYAIATKPQKRALWPEQAFIWEASDPYLYLRTTDDGRVICGGEDEDFTDETARDALLPQKAARISAKLKTLFPAIDPEPDFAWTGSFGATKTGLPFIGRVPGYRNIHAVLGYGGNGITFSRIASEIVTTAIGGGEDRDARLFDFPKGSALLRPFTRVLEAISPAD